jgi:hypothetical protein
VSQQRAKPGISSDDGPPLFVAFDPKTSSGVKRTSASKREFPTELKLCLHFLQLSCIGRFTVKMIILIDMKRQLEFAHILKYNIFKIIQISDLMKK